MVDTIDSPMAEGSTTRDERTERADPTKRPRTESSTSQAIVLHPIHADTSKTAEDKKPSGLIDAPIVRLTTEVNPVYIRSLRETNSIGYYRPFAQRVLTPRYIEISPKSFRACIENTMIGHLTIKYREHHSLSTAQAAIEVATVATLVGDVCCSALYAKLRTIHKQYQKYASRYSTAAVYSKDIELPLPFADVISNIGVFETRACETNQLIVPVFPEGTKNEGRSSDEFEIYKWQSYIPILKDLGIPMKSIDPRDKSGSAWWTYKIEKVVNNYDFKCIFPPLLYSNLSAYWRGLFCVQSTTATGLFELVKLEKDEVDYPVRFRDFRLGDNLRIFSALCGDASEDWNFKTHLMG